MLINPWLTPSLQEIPERTQGISAIAGGVRSLSDFSNFGKVDPRFVRHKTGILSQLQFEAGGPPNNDPKAGWLDDFVASHNFRDIPAVLVCRQAGAARDHRSGSGRLFGRGHYRSLLAAVFGGCDGECERKHVNVGVPAVGRDGHIDCGQGGRELQDSAGAGHDPASGRRFAGGDQGANT